MPPKRTSTSAAPAITQAAIRQLVADSITIALESHAANMAIADNTNRNPELREDHVARKCSYKEFMRCQPFNFKDSEKMMEAFIGGLPQSIEGNVTASKPQTIKEAINIAQRLMDQVTKHTSVQVSSDHKRKFDDRSTFNNNIYRNTTTNNRYNNHRLQQNKRQETFRSYVATPTKNGGYNGNHPLWIAKVAIGWFLGCEDDLDSSKGGEDSDQCGTLFIGEKFVSWVYKLEFCLLATLVPEVI
nr:reverse transcriptase domain-containing protein [Tanacetum cinerariifolium]